MGNDMIDEQVETVAVESGGKVICRVCRGSNLIAPTTHWVIVRTLEDEEEKEGITALIILALLESVHLGPDCFEDR